MAGLCCDILLFCRTNSPKIFKFVEIAYPLLHDMHYHVCEIYQHPFP